MIKVLLPLFIALTLTGDIVFGQEADTQKTNTHRRHFLIFYDISFPFYSKEMETEEFKNTLVNLFLNKKLQNFQEPFLLKEERLNAVRFFDNQKDEISFFYFGLNIREADNLWRNRNFLKDKKTLYSEFRNNFFKEPSFRWGEYKKTKGNSNVNSYLDTLWSLEKPEWGNGYSFSNLVYPLGMDAVSSSAYSQEYIIIILSDFLTGADLGNKKDIKLLKNIFKNQSYYYDDILSKYDLLSGKFHKIDYLDFEFKTGSYRNGEEVLLGIVAYKIRPNSGKEKPDETWLFLDSDVRVNQKSFGSEAFNISLQSLKFAHNVNFSIDRVEMKITDNNNEDLFKNEMNYEVSYDKNKFPVYRFDDLDINLKGIQTYKDAKIRSPIFVNYSLYGKYKLYENSFLNLVYETPSRNVFIGSSNFKTKKSIVLMYIFLPTILLILLIYILFYLARPKGLMVEITRFTDSFERIKSDKGFSRLLTDYLPATSTDRGFTANLLINGALQFGNMKLFTWRKVKVSAEIYTIETKPEKLDIFLKKSEKSTAQYYVRDRLNIVTNGKGFDLLLYFVNNDSLHVYDEPEEVKLNILFKITEKRLFFIKPQRTEKVISCHFQIGPELGDLWVGIDPGTSGTCMAAAVIGNNIVMQKNEVGDEEIMPSILSFNPKSAIGDDQFPNYYRQTDEGGEKYFRYGKEADQRLKLDIIFQSVKKLLGYKDVKRVVFTDNEIQLSGKQLTALLINGSFNELNNFITKNRIDFDSDIPFNPKRAVVAVPNNFTISKVADMIGAFEGVQDANHNKRFKEIRYVYEAEAILFNYIANYNKFNTDELKEERVLIFDMGGATINATVVGVNTYLDEKNQMNYRTDILGKLGYGIGGDTIDYVLAKILLEYSLSYKELNNYLKNAFNKNHQDSSNNRTELKRVTLELKKAIIKNANAKKDFILNPTELSEVIRKELGISISIHDDDKFLNLIGFKETIKAEVNELEKKYSDGIVSKTVYDQKIKPLRKKLASKSSTLFEHPAFKKYILSNVASAVKDVLDLSNSTVDTVIFSGRSVFFPRIKETVLMLAKKSKVVDLSFTESKTAVAKGACWYGVNKSRIQLNNVKTNGTFGFKHSPVGTDGHGEFIKLVDFGQRFNSRSDLPKIVGEYFLEDDFGFDNHHVEFYQIMGKNTKEIINNKELSHKRNKIARIKADLPAAQQWIEVFENDMVTCSIKLVTGKVNTAESVVSDMEINKENEEHYTWYVE